MSNMDSLLSRAKAIKDANDNLKDSGVIKDGHAQITEADVLIAEIEGNTRELAATRKWLESMSFAIEGQVTGATNRIQLMEDGVIPASFRDMAELYKKLSIIMSQLRAVQAKAKKFIINDPAAPKGGFYVGDTFYEHVVTKQMRFATADWKKADPTGYAAVRLIHEKEVEVNKFTYKLLKGAK